MLFLFACPPESGRVRMADALRIAASGHDGIGLLKQGFLESSNEGMRELIALAAQRRTVAPHRDVTGGADDMINHGTCSAPVPSTARREHG